MATLYDSVSFSSAKPEEALNVQRSTFVVTVLHRADAVMVITENADAIIDHIWTSFFALLNSNFRMRRLSFKL
jgi:hypothetical protein